MISQGGKKILERFVSTAKNLLMENVTQMLQQHYGIWADGHSIFFPPCEIISYRMGLFVNTKFNGMLFADIIQMILQFGNNLLYFIASCQAAFQLHLARLFGSLMSRMRSIRGCLWCSWRCGNNSWRMLSYHLLDFATDGIDTTIWQIECSVAVHHHTEIFQCG